MAKFPDRQSDKSKAGTDAPARDAPTANAPLRERRASHRVADDQKSGHGSLSAMSKMQMILRRRAAMTPRDKEPDE